MHLTVPKMTTKGGVVVAGNTEVGFEALWVDCTETDHIHMSMLQSTKGHRLPGVLEDGVITHLYTHSGMALRSVTVSRQNVLAL